jgi:PKD repeat protein
MSSVGNTNRVGWLEQPTCQACHTGTATDNNGQIRYLDAHDGANLRVAVNQTFGTTPDAPAAGFSLYRFSEGHGGLQCSACHGSPHAIYPSFHQNDNLQNQDLQGQAGTLGDCSVCHAASTFSAANNFLSGPHGMHQTGSNWITQGDHNHKKAVETLGANSCKACHGANERGSVLSAALTDQALTWSHDGQTFNQFFWQGAIISCYSCHKGSGSDDTNNQAAATVSGISAVISANTDAVMPLSISNPSGLALFTRIITPPRYGMAAVSNGTHAVYRPFYNFTGTDQFTYAAYNTEKDSNLATGTVTVVEGTCVLVCESLVPANASSRAELPFWAYASISNCTDAVSYLWGFGDGGGSTNALARHAYGKNGTYPWSLIASAAGMSVTNTGSVTVGNFQLDTDGDGIEDDWEWINFQSLETAGATTDFDQDGQTDLAEYLAGTHPKDALSQLKVTDLSNTKVIRWASSENRIYSINATTSLVATAFAPLATDLSATPPENTYTDLTTSAESMKFYRIELE